MCYMPYSSFHSFVIYRAVDAITTTNVPVQWKSY